MNAAHHHAHPKLSRNQSEILACLRKAKEPMSAYAILDRVRTSGISHPPTVYRALTELMQKGMVHRLQSRSAFIACGHGACDGKFAFVVTSVEKRGTTITDRLGGTDRAQGEFVIVRVSVTNIGYEARTLTATDQFVVSNMGARFATSDEISGLRGAELIFREKVNPGSTVNDAPLLFDVPAGTTIAGVELHDSLTSTGVKVTIGKAPVRENELP